jgi:NADPH:quinone reductase-like Zn-dependent oxidoreductase
MIGVFDGFEFSGHFVPLVQKRLVIEGIQVGHRRSLEDMVDAIGRIGLKPVIDSEFPMADLPLALERLELGPFGKVVVNTGR